MYEIFNNGRCREKMEDGELKIENFLDEKGRIHDFNHGMECGAMVEIISYRKIQVRK